MMHLNGLRNSIDSLSGFALDTTFVLFFLGLEFGRTIQDVTLDAVLLFLTMLMIIVLPYYLPSKVERVSFAKWLTGRSLIAALSMAIGAALAPLYGKLLPESFRFLPLTLLILAAVASCFAQFYAVMRLRLVK